MKTFLALCLIGTLTMAVAQSGVELHDNQNDTNHVFVIAGDLSGGNPQPCMKNPNNNAYNNFKKKHIINSNPSFDTSNKKAWAKYLDKKNLCGRVPVQSFFRQGSEGKVRAICKGQGFVYNRNLCVSQNTFTVFHVSSQVAKPCKVTRIVSKKQKVILACDAVANQCLPVHYEKYNGQKPGSVTCK
ncbi:hypothetical protein ACEWY4_024899 [Coilia grayii]|uniref:Uncharacterized protein n=1 Tax=Coilia grayii TaxID=363190 RepID=A0ABD1IYR1_9TELE